MGLRETKHEIINDININDLLRKFTTLQLSYFFQVPEDYITKTRNLQRIEAEENFNNNIYNNFDEMKLGRVGAWKLSKERKSIKELKNEKI
jgi:hypothetical protein